VKKLLVISLFFAGIICAVDNIPAPAQKFQRTNLADPSKIFLEANKLYDAERYTEAAELYEKILGEGAAGAEIFYNTGSAYFKDKKIGKAVLWYERAHLLSPRDGDIAFNLDYARGFVKKSAVSDGASRFIENVYGFLTLDELTVLTTLLVILFSVLLFLRRKSFSESGFWVLISAGIVTFIFLIWSGMRFYENETVTEAIALMPETEARAAPQTDNPVTFTIPEGSKMQIIQIRSGWYEIYMKSENLKGWVKKDNIGVIKFYQ
jgi:tetratricopeptide (TPR) repeat protein